jgi:hypothetical protein
VVDESEEVMVVLTAKQMIMSRKNCEYFRVMRMENKMGKKDHIKIK